MARRRTLGYIQNEWTCPNCDTRNKGGSKTCENCGLKKCYGECPHKAAMQTEADQGRECPQWIPRRGLYVGLRRR